MIKTLIKFYKEKKGMYEYYTAVKRVKQRFYLLQTQKANQDLNMNVTISETPFIVKLTETPHV